MAKPPSFRPRFWETVPLQAMTKAEWEALCDGCGKCCLNKIEYEDTGEVDYTNIACRLLDGQTCRCTKYSTRRKYVPDCVQLTPARLPDVAYWLPKTCAYKLLFQGKPLFDWHPLVTGDPETVHAAGMSVRGKTVPETDVHEDDWDNHIIAETP